MPNSNKLNRNWKKKDWDTLIYAINQNNCILMLGPDTAVETVDGQPRLLTESLTNQLVEELEPDTPKTFNPSDLAQVSQYYEEEIGRNSLETIAASFYKEKQGLCSDLHRNLAALPFYFTITTTPDSMLIHALKENNKEPVINWYNFNGENLGMVQMGTVEKPLVFYLYGAMDEPESLMLTENNLLDFLVALSSGKRPLPGNIRSELRDEKKIFLFLGFGFRHWYLRILLHVLQGPQTKSSRSFALEKFLPENNAELQSTAFFFKKKDYKIHIFKEDFNGFARQLKDRFEPCSPAAISRMEAAKKPEVFICHASEDKDYAAALYKKLEQAGIRPWLDKENLQGGDEWDRKIRDTIKQIDYFVVLQSQALANKTIGYVSREINIALDRQEEFQRGTTRFVIPVKIEPCPLRDDLKHLQTIDLIDEANVKTLIDTIQRDFEKRKKR